MGSLIDSKIQNKLTFKLTLDASKQKAKIKNTIASIRRYTQISFCALDTNDSYICYLNVHYWILQEYFPQESEPD